MWTKSAIPIFGTCSSSTANGVEIKGALVLLDKTTGAILTAANASKVSIEIVAQAFGFSQGITDIVANSYLFSLPPSTVTKNVKDAQFAYRGQTETDKLTISSAALAYARIRGYLALCFPQSIEAQIDANLAQTKGEAKTPETKTAETTMSAKKKKRLAATLDLARPRFTTLSQPAGSAVPPLVETVPAQ